MTRIPGPTRLFLAGNTVSMAGTGLVIAFTLIYLHQMLAGLTPEPAAQQRTFAVNFTLQNAALGPGTTPPRRDRVDLDRA